jgi:hypothetical protein
MKINQANTSVDIYHSEIKGETEKSQDKIVYLALLAMGKPASMRMIQKHLKDNRIELEVNIMSRAMFGLKKGKNGLQIYFVGDRGCEVNKRMVKFFSTDKPKEDPIIGQQLSI